LPLALVERGQALASFRKAAVGAIGPDGAPEPALKCSGFRGWRTNVGIRLCSERPEAGAPWAEQAADQGSTTHGLSHSAASPQEPRLPW